MFVVVVGIQEVLESVLSVVYLVYAMLDKQVVRFARLNVRWKSIKKKKDFVQYAMKLINTLVEIPVVISVLIHIARGQNENEKVSISKQQISGFKYGFGYAYCQRGK